MSPRYAKIPAKPRAPLTLDSSHLKQYQGVLWRIFGTKGAHPQVWDQMRHVGPIATMRFDPHPPPKREHDDYSVMYTALNSHTAFGEVFQGRRVVSRTARGNTLAGWIPTRELTLLDLSGDWPVVNGTTAAIQMGAKRHTRNWAHEIHEQLGDQVDGLYHLSSINSAPMITLFTPAADSFPALPSVHTRLDSPGANVYLTKAIKRLNYRVGR
ncbi:RES family NAD+ phosphorylase [Microbacterium sp.]|uniref:RES family NAD+ phosphorylase n=1 Tax=Microbacterium sp. TaxID=51671 RepID=UPI002637460A|nr:RES family NAD+ phosphorylase [Microbacterium sp.]MCV0336377.1 RES family NAD+ phosphorylase [Microbacterium sp.]MCV0376685.1 RES family NAD+ phosphorylase [Microbacterium sp.]MCV0391434.1 RES family NAD+ phosphorylase [Microbacterium sp.]MCV0420040.1 RES family NAD+ phosphorylase [Microbacterium sp.]MCV0423789.1 RES family NAD+ phosphorylase [Microbacterium sp.]